MSGVKGANAKLQIHKYTNTACVEVPERPNMWYIFEKRIVQGYQKIIFPCVKYANAKQSAGKTQHMVHF